MPDRRIDAIGKTDAASWNSVQLPKGSSNLLRIISGQLSNFRPGEIINAMVQKSADGTFKVSLKGETFTFKGMPATLAGKEVAFVVQQSTLKGSSKLELAWVAPNKAQAALNQSQTRQAKLSTNILSDLPAALKAAAGKVLSGRIDLIQSGKMTVFVAVADPKNPGKTIRLPVTTALLSGLKEGQVLKEGEQVSVKIQMKASGKPVLEIGTGQQPAKAAIQAGDKAAVQADGKAAIQTGDKPALQLDAKPGTQAANAAAAKTVAAQADPIAMKLSPGETLPALVQKRLAEGFVQLNIKGTIVEAPAPKTVQKGDLLLLQLNKSGSGFQLLSVQKNVGEKALLVLKANMQASSNPVSQSLSVLRNSVPTTAASNLPQTATLPGSALPQTAALPGSALPQTGTLPQLETWLKSVEVSQQQPISGERVAQMIRDSGSGLEARLLAAAQKPGQSPALQNDLKAIFLQLAEAQAGKAATSEMIRILTEFAQSGSSRIESGQALNVLASLQGEPLRFELPMLVNQQFVNVQLAIQQNTHYESEGSEESHGSNQSFNVLFALELSGLGHMRVDANISDKSVHARIYNEQMEANQFILDNIQRLETRLNDLGYSDVYLLTSHSQPETEKMRSFEQLENMAPASLSLLDIRI